MCCGPTARCPGDSSAVAPSPLWPSGPGAGERVVRGRGTWWGNSPFVFRREDEMRRSPSHPVGHDGSPLHPPIEGNPCSWPLHALRRETPSPVTLGGRAGDPLHSSAGVRGDRPPSG